MAEENNIVINEEVDLFEEKKKILSAFISAIVKQTMTAKYIRRVRPREFQARDLILRRVDIGGKNVWDGKLAEIQESPYWVAANTGK